MRRPKLILRSIVCSVLCAASQAQTFTNLSSFNGTDGASPRNVALAQGLDGNLYGTTSLGGANNHGTVFRVTTWGELTTMHSFLGTDGSDPWAGLVLAANGSFYGTANRGGSSTYTGTLFKMTPDGTLTTLVRFNRTTNGEYPTTGLVQADNGSLYGTTPQGGAYPYGGTIFKLTLAGALTTLYNFPGSPDGFRPLGALVQATDGNFYGTTYQGGAVNYGTVFKMTASGELTTLYRFTGGTDGAAPSGALVQATDGNFYGTTTYKGDAFCGCGTVFKMTPNGTLTTLYSFTGLDGNRPEGGLVQATDGNVYGTTYQGGTKDWGTIFRITLSGTLTTLHSFSGRDGLNPSSGVFQATDGNLYGVTESGGSSGDGAVFELSLGLGPFVMTLPTFGNVASAVKILGTNMNSATSVTFNGVPATFRVVSPTEITTNVPAGANTGTVQVVTPAGTLSSNVAFQVP